MNLRKAIGCVLAGFLIVASASAVAAQGRNAGTEELSGSYEGHYVCGQSQPVLKLTIEIRDNGPVIGVFTAVWPNLPLMAFSFSGNYDSATQTLRATPIKWETDRPPGFQMVAFEGKFDSTTQRISGKIDYPSCGQFTATRTGISTAGAEQPNTAQMPSPSITRPTSNQPNAPLSQLNMPSCDSIYQWSAQVNREYPGTDFGHMEISRLNRIAINLFADEYFVPVFGVPFQQLSAQQRLAIAQTMHRCFSDRSGPMTWQKVVIDRPFSLPGGTFSYSEVLPELSTNRQVREQCKNAVSQVKAFPTESASYQKAVDVRAHQKTTCVDLWPSEVQQLTNASEETMRRVAPMALTDMVNQAVSLPGSLAAVTALDRLALRNRELFDMAPEDLSRGERGQITTTIHQDLVMLMAEKSAEMNGFGGGLMGLANSARWAAQFQNYSFVSSDPAVASTYDQFLKQRTSLWKEAEPALQALINKAENPQAIGALLGRYTISADRQDPSVAPIFTAVTNREAAISHEQEMAMYSPLEHKLMVGGKIQVPASYGPPTNEEMSLAIVRGFANVGGHIIDAHTTTYGLPPFQRFFYTTIQVNRIEGKCNPSSKGGYDCNLKAFMHYEYPDKSEQGQMMQTLFDIYNNAEPSNAQEHFVLTPLGWNSPTWEEQLMQGVNQFYQMAAKSLSQMHCASAVASGDIVTATSAACKQ